MKKRLVLMIMMILAICCMSACGKKESDKNEKAILVVSFGTSYNDSRDVTIGAIEKAIEKAYPDYEMRRAFTSQIIIDKLKDRDNLEIDNVEEALDRAAADGIKELVVQPTHLMDGYEYEDLAVALTEYKDKFDKVMLGQPLLMEDSDFETVIDAITKKTASYDDGSTAICFMGHGTGAESNKVYGELQKKIMDAGYKNYYIGTVEGTPTISDVVALLKENGTYKKVILEPLMVVAGDHANNDMAGSEEDSWKSILEKEGYSVECILEGLGQIPEIQNLYVKHLKETIDLGKEFTGVERSEKTEETETSEEALADGTYAITVETSSSMFKVVKAELTVAAGKMTAVVTLSGTGYGKLYMGTADKAASANDSEYIPFVEDAEGAYTYTIPVESLDTPLDCAAFSTKKEEWYDRQITFVSSSASAIEAQEKEKLEDGTYEIELAFEGGSGKAKILPQAKLIVTSGNMAAIVQWNSPNYDYMIVDEAKYLPSNMEGDSIFQIPVEALDKDIVVIGDTIAMSKPHEIEYTLNFKSETLKKIEE